MMISHDVIINEVCKYYNVISDKIGSKNRTKLVSHARSIAMYLCYILVPNMSYSKISNIFSRDHSTCIQNINKVRGFLETDIKTKCEIDELMLNIDRNSKMALNLDNTINMYCKMLDRMLNHWICSTHRINSNKSKDVFNIIEEFSARLNDVLE